MFSKLDFKKGYNKIPVMAADIPKKAVMIPFGMFGLRDGGQSIQILIDIATADLPAVFAYLDDVIAASSPEHHVEVLGQVLQQLQQYGLVLNLYKFIFVILRWIF
jgi:hypothetical protein